MEIWLDTCDSHAVEFAQQFGVIYGVTTNPSILSSSGEDYEKVISSLLDIQDGPVAVQVTAEKAEEIIQQALSLQSYSSRIIVKIPVVQQGLMAMKALVQQEIPVMGTAIYTPTQALLAALAGADYVAPYFSHIEESGVDPFAILNSILCIYQLHGFRTKILAASLREPSQITTCAEIGIEAVTLKSALFNKFIADEPLTVEFLKKFTDDWKANVKQSSPSLIL